MFAENHRTEIANQEVVTESGDIVDETEQETVGPILPKRYYVNGDFFGSPNQRFW